MSLLTGYTALVGVAVTSDSMRHGILHGDLDASP